MTMYSIGRRALSSFFVFAEDEEFSDVRDRHLSAELGVWIPDYYRGVLNWRDIQLDYCLNQPITDAPIYSDS